MTSAQAPEQLPTVTASQIEPPPAWATMQRHLMRTVEEAALVAAEKYARPSGLVYHVHDVDDAYESRSMRGRFYAIGASEKMLEISLKEWDAMTRFYDDGVKQPEGMPPNHMNMPQLHNEWWNLAVPYNSDAFHMGEGSQYFYDFGLADQLGDDPPRPPFCRALPRRGS